MTFGLGRLHATACTEVVCYAELSDRRIGPTLTASLDAFFTLQYVPNSRLGTDQNPIFPDSASKWILSCPCSVSDTRLYAATSR